MTSKKIKNLLTVFATLQVTKELPRQGFYYWGFKRTEADSVASHIFGVCSIAYFLSRELEIEGYLIDPQRVLELAFLHDMSEAIVGDIGTHVKRMLPGKFQEFEEESFRMLTKHLSDKDRYRSMFEEYEKLATAEAKIVKLADTIDAVFQGLSTPSARLDGWEHVKKEEFKEIFANDRILGNTLKEIYSVMIDELFARKVRPIGEHIDS